MTPSKGPDANETQGFDQARFEALVLYIAGRTKDDEHFGRTKLAKVLFYSDFAVYRGQGTSLTGATYLHMPFGPFPRELADTEKRLSSLGLIELDYVKEAYEEKRIILRSAPPDLAHFERWQIMTVDDWIVRIQPLTAVQISELTHKTPGWRLAYKTGSEIPYATALLPQERPSTREAREAENLARERGWLSDDVWRWQRPST